MSELRWLLLLRLAGPYRLDGDWLLSSGGPETDGSDLVAHEAFQGAVDDEALAIILDELGVHPDHHSGWLARVGCLHKTEIGWIDTSGTIADSVARWMAGRGAPCGSEELGAFLAFRKTPLRSARQILIDDPRFIRADKDRFALASWGLEPYDGVAAEMQSEIEAQGGSVPIDSLISALGTRHRISEVSIRMYAERPMFFIDEFDHVSIRDESNPFVPSEDLSRAAGCQELDHGEVAWRVKVDGEILRGSGRRVPSQLAGYLKVVPGTTMSFEGRNTSLRISWTLIGQPGVSSMRGLVQTMGGIEGDYLVVVFNRDGRADAAVVRQQDMDSEPIVSAARLLGYLRCDDPADALVKLSEALDVTAQTEVSRRTRIRAKMLAGQHADLADLLAT